MISLMIVDDDEWILKGIRSIIDWAEYGMEIVDEATDGDTAFKKITGLQPDLVFTDIVMPGTSGLQLLGRLNGQGIKSEFIILTGYAEFSYAQEACRLGAFDYLLKPLEEDDLLDVIERFKQKYSIMHDNDTEKVCPSSLPRKSSHTTLNLVLRYMQENYSSSLHLYEVAEHFHFNSSYISQLFGKELGISFSEYLTRYRLDMSEKLLMESTLPVKSICLTVGIPDYFYFNKLFKKYKGFTPSQIRNSQKQAVAD